MTAGSRNRCSGHLWEGEENRSAQQGRSSPRTGAQGLRSSEHQLWNSKLAREAPAGQFPSVLSVCQRLSQSHCGSSAWLDPLSIAPSSSHPLNRCSCNSSLACALSSQLFISSSSNKEPTVCLEQCWTLVTTAIAWSQSCLPPQACHSNCVYRCVSGEGEAVNPAGVGHSEAAALCSVAVPFCKW